MKAKQLLAGYSIPSETVKLDSNLSSRGCAYGLRIDSRFEKNALRILDENSIHYSAVK